MVMSFAGYSFCKGHSCSYIQVAQKSCYLRANHPAEFFAGVLANGGGFYHPFAYVAEAGRQGLRILPPDVNASAYRTTARGDSIRIGLQFVKGLAEEAARRIVTGRSGPYGDLEDLRARAGLSHDDLRILIKVGAGDSIAGRKTRPMLLWELDRQADAPDDGFLTVQPSVRPSDRPSDRPTIQLREYTPERRRTLEYDLLGFTTDCHPMELYRERLARFRLCRSTDLPRHVGQVVLAAGMFTTAKPVTTAQDEPMEFVTFDDGHGLIESVLFPDVYRDRGHVLFDQGPFIFRGKVEEEFGAVTLTITHLERLERMLAKLSARAS